jgi:hypothetical protein
MQVAAGEAILRGKKGDLVSLLHEFIHQKLQKQFNSSVIDRWNASPERRNLRDAKRS